jgi:hypothetical protein
MLRHDFYCLAATGCEKSQISEGVAKWIVGKAQPSQVNGAHRDAPAKIAGNDGRYATSKAKIAARR